MEAAGGGGEVEGCAEAGVCHVLKGQHRVYLRSHRVSLRSVMLSSPAACVWTLAAGESRRDDEFLTGLPASS